MTVATRANGVLRAGILRAADDRHVQGFMGRYGMRLGAARFVAGETLDECVVVLRRLAGQGLHANTTAAGRERPRPWRGGGRGRGVRARARAARRGRAAVQRRAQADPSRPRARRGARRTRTSSGSSESRSASGASYGSTWSSRASSTRRCGSTAGCAQAGHDRVGTVLQSYLYRTESDLESLLPLAPNLRFVKGAYLEPAEIALHGQGRRRRRVPPARRDGAPRRRVRGDSDARRGAHRAVSCARRARGDRPRPLRAPDALRRAARASARARAAGYKVLVATPYGPEWYPYLMRRLAERPANLGFFARNLVRPLSYRMSNSS